MPEINAGKRYCPECEEPVATRDGFCADCGFNHFPEPRFHEVVVTVIEACPDRAGVYRYVTAADWEDSQQNYAAQIRAARDRFGDAVHITVNREASSRAHWRILANRLITAGPEYQRAAFAALTVADAPWPDKAEEQFEHEFGAFVQKVRFGTSVGFNADTGQIQY